jgi:DhnA family fructose-bisphosphate aldolase class Ia
MIFGQDRVDLMRQNFSFVANSIEACHRVGLPVMVEATTWGLGFTGKKIKGAKLLADLARIAFETGADVVKSDFPEDPGDMEKIANACPAPVVILGGGKTKSIEGVLTDVLGCVQSGAAGVAFGRNVWQYPDPAKFVRAIQLVVHEQDLRGALDSLEEETENITRVI